MAASAQSITYSTVTAPSASTPVPPTDAQQIEAVAVDSAGRRFFADSTRHAILSVPQGANAAAVIAGRNDLPGSADGAVLATALFVGPSDVAVDAAGSAFVRDGSNIRKIAPDGVVSTFRRGVQGELTIDKAGNLFLAHGCLIEKITPGGVATPFAGKAGACGFADGASDTARFSDSLDIAMGSNGSLYVGDRGNYTIRVIAPDGQVSTLAGSPLASGYVDGTGSAARFGWPSRIAVDDMGTVYVMDGIWTVRRVSSAGVVTTLAGSPQGGVETPTSGPRFAFLYSIAARGDGIVVVADGPLVKSISPSGAVTTAGQASHIIWGMTFSSDATLYLAVAYSSTVETLSPLGLVETLAGIKDAAGTRDGPGRAVARFNAPAGLAAAVAGLHISDTGNHTIRRLVERSVSTIAGLAGAAGSADGTGSAARFNSPRGIAVDAAGNVYVADTGNHTIRKVAPDGTVTTVAGQAGAPGSVDGAAAAARFNAPRGLTVDAAGLVYVADTGNHAIRSITSSGVVTTIAGLPGNAGAADGIGAAARFSSPAGITIGAAGAVYVADTGNHTIRAVTSAGAVTTVGGAAGSVGLADGLAAAARFSSPNGLTTDAAGTLYVADTGNRAVRMGVVGTPSTPVMTSHPASRGADLRRSVQFTCGATGNPSPGYAWQERRFSFSAPVTIAEGGVFAGTNSPTLTILDVSADMDGRRFSCVATNAAGTASSATATLSVNLLQLSPSRLAFGGVVASGGGYSSITSPQTVTVGWAGAGAPAWTVSTDQSWVHLSNANGAGAGAFTVAVTDPGVGVSPFASPVTATITLASPDDPEYTRTIGVYFKGYASNAGPDGSFDTPATGSGLQGSLPITGWALDTIEMDRVEIWRDAVAGETTPVFMGGGPGNGKIFIANGTFVPGARPDVEALASFYNYVAPRNAGWGYMLLTQGLWNEGNGTFKLYAFAFDKAGAFSTLGTKTITIDNARATKPFGTIDTPNYGGTVSGTFHNFGWALTPGPCSITNPNVLMSIDSGPLTPVVYGDVRPDVATRFAAYTNGAAAGGHFTIDTTTLTNGMHTIGWLVTDSCGRAEGIGSRFFTVANAASVAAAPAASSVAASSPRAWGLSRNGTDAELGTAHDGTRVVRMNQAERIEVQLPGAAPYLSAGALPIGSSLDQAIGRFSWQPAAGFLGAYELQFSAGSRLERVRVVVGPPIRLAIDTPKAGNVLAAEGFSLAGWAVDLASTAGPGIDTLHVWAHPAGGGAPQFVGDARPGASRPDVATLYGQFFSDAGFALTGALPPGTYDLVVYAHSAATNRFEGAEAVRVVVK